MSASSQPAAMDQLTFDGKNGENITDFFRNFFRLALASGRQRDDEWMVDSLESCLGGEALTYYSGLDDRSHSTFKNARAALIQRFAPPVGSQPEPPAAAAPPRRSMSRSSDAEDANKLTTSNKPADRRRQRSTSSGPVRPSLAAPEQTGTIRQAQDSAPPQPELQTTRGRIRVHSSQTTAPLGYLRQEGNPSEYGINKDRKDALLLDYVTNTEFYNLKLPDGGYLDVEISFDENALDKLEFIPERRTPSSPLDLVKWDWNQTSNQLTASRRNFLSGKWVQLYVYHQKPTGSLGPRIAFPRKWWLAGDHLNAVKLYFERAWEFDGY